MCSTGPQVYLYLLPDCEENDKGIKIKNTHSIKDFDQREKSILKNKDKNKRPS